MSFSCNCVSTVLERGGREGNSAKYLTCTFDFDSSVRVFSSYKTKTDVKSCGAYIMLLYLMTVFFPWIVL